MFQFLRQEAWQATPVASVPSSILAASLDLGERESIALAVLHSALLLIDEEAGRYTARSFRLSVRGSLGVLIEAYHNKLIGTEQLRFYFAEIEQRTDIWISSTLCRSLLTETLIDD